MPAIVTTLDREIVREERLVGLPTDRPLTDKAIAHRRLQIGIELLVAGLTAVFAAFAARGQVQILATAVACLFGMYAVEKDRHLRKLATLHGDVERISLIVARELMYTGALKSDRELLDVEDGIGRAAGRMATGLASLLPAHCTRVRLTGPGGEVPVAAERDLTDRPILDDPSVAVEAVKARTPFRKAIDGRSVLAVPMWRDKDIVGVLEVVSKPAETFTSADAAVVDAFARGVIAVLMAPPADLD